MKSTIIVLTMLLIAHATIAQTFVVTESRKCFSLTNKKVRKGDTLDIRSGFSIEKDGTLVLRHSNGWHSVHTIPAMHKVDTIVSKLKTTRGYILHDSIYNLLKEKNIHTCDFTYRFICKPVFGGVASSYADNIKQEADYRNIETTDSTIRIEWDYPVDYKGKYYVLVTNLFNENLDLKITNENIFELDLIPYKPHHAILYKVISEECRESKTNVIKMK